MRTSEQTVSVKLLSILSQYPCCCNAAFEKHCPTQSRRLDRSCKDEFQSIPLGANTLLRMEPFTPFIVNNLNNTTSLWNSESACSATTTTTRKVNPCPQANVCAS